MVLELAVNSYHLYKHRNKENWYWWGGSLLITLNILFALALWTTVELPGKGGAETIGVAEEGGRLRFLSEDGDVLRFLSDEGLDGEVVADNN